MVQALEKLLRNDQNTLNQKIAVAEQAEQFLQKFCRAINEAAGKNTVDCRRVYAAERVAPFAYLSLVNHADTMTVQVPSLFGVVDEERTASYKISFGTVKHGLLSRIFLGAVSQEPAIGVNKDYVRIGANGESRCVADGKLAALWNKDCTEHYPLNSVMAEIYSTLSEDIRKKVSIDSIVPLAEYTVQFNPGPWTAPDPSY